MSGKTKINTADVGIWAKKQTGPVSLMSALGILAWTTFAEPRIEELLNNSEKIKSMEKSIENTQKKVGALETTVSYVRFETRQTFALVQRLAGDSLSDLVKKETRIFKPEGYEDIY